MRAGEVRRVDRWLSVFIGLGTAFVWAANAINAAFSADSLSSKSFVSWFAVVMTGCALGAALSIFRTSVRTRDYGNDVVTRRSDDARATSLLMALMGTGLGMQPILDAPVGALSMVLMVVMSMMGGIAFGLALVPQRPQRARREGQVGEGHDAWSS